MANCDRALVNDLIWGLLTRVSMYKGNRVDDANECWSAGVAFGTIHVKENGMNWRLRIANSIC
jgi:hypothetical protein